MTYLTMNKKYYINGTLIIHIEHSDSTHTYVHMYVCCIYNEKCQKFDQNKQSRKKEERTFSEQKSCAKCKHEFGY